jgi:hypothetical protein
MSGKNAVKNVATRAVFKHVAMTFSHRTSVTAALALKSPKNEHVKRDLALYQSTVNGTGGSFRSAATLVAAPRQGS